MKFFLTGSRKIFFSEACKKLFRGFYSRFSISRHLMAVEVFEVLSVAMTSSLEVVRIKKIIDFGVSGPTEFSSEPFLDTSPWFCFVVMFTGLRFARPYRRPSLRTTASADIRNYESQHFVDNYKRCIIK